MEADVKAGRFLEHGEYDGNLYGTKIESIHEVVAAGRTCILDVNPQVRGRAGARGRGREPASNLPPTPPQALKVLKTAEFMPYVVFIAAPDFDTLKAMHKAVVDAGITTKQLTVRPRLPNRVKDGFGSADLLDVAGAGRGPEEDGGRERSHPEGVRPLLRPDRRQRQPGQGLRGAADRRGRAALRPPVGARELGVLTAWTPTGGVGGGGRGVQQRRDASTDARPRSRARTPFSTPS